MKLPIGSVADALQIMVLQTAFAFIWLAELRSIGWASWTWRLADGSLWIVYLIAPAIYSRPLTLSGTLRILRTTGYIYLGIMILAMVAYMEFARRYGVPVLQAGPK